jgi:hypothetical protein
MSSSDTEYAPRFSIPEFIERGRDNKITAPVYRNGTLVAPVSGTVSVYKADQTAVVNAAVVTIAGSVASYTIPAVSIGSLVLEDGWLVEWTLTMPDGVAHVFRRDGALVRRRLYPVIADIDLLRRHRDLGQLREAGVTSYQDYLDEAFCMIENRLIGGGKRPYLVMSPAAFREAHVCLSLHLIWNDYATSAGDTSRYQQLADSYGQAYENAWQQLTFHYDVTDENVVNVDRRNSGSPTLWLNSTGGQYPLGYRGIRS